MVSSVILLLCLLSASSVSPFPGPDADPAYGGTKKIKSWEDGVEATLNHPVEGRTLLGYSEDLHLHHGHHPNELKDDQVDDRALVIHEIKNNGTVDENDQVSRR